MALTRRLAFVTAIAGMACGCASSVSEEQDVLEAAQTALPSISLPELGGTASPPPIRGTPTDVYTRVARGAVTCWFGADGPLKKSYVYHAVAKPPSKGGQARILIHKRDNALRDKRGARAYAIDIVPDGKTAELVFQNATMGEPRGTDMAKDAQRWAAGIEGCIADPVASGWDAQPKTKSKRRRSAAKKTKK